jgi:hypothetical protein
VGGTSGRAERDQRLVSSTGMPGGPALPLRQRLFGDGHEVLLGFRRMKLLLLGYGNTPLE